MKKRTQLTKKKLFGILCAFCLIGFAGYKIYQKACEPDLAFSPHPDGKNFAFTITDDPDKNRFEKVKLVYDFLAAEGLKTTALVWVKRADKTNLQPIEPVINYRYGDTTENTTYLKYFQQLQNKGFEIGTHTISAGADYREDTVKGFEIFKKQFGQYPKMVIMHSQNLDNLYWGKYIFSNSIIQYLVGLIIKVPYMGHIEGSKYFWGDIAKKHVKYTRLWGTTGINTLAFNPNMPFHDKKKKYVNYFHSFSDGYNYKIFMNLMTDKNIQKLKKERGISIVYTHFADGFVKNFILQPNFKEQIKKISRDDNAWLAPASKILDRLLLLKNVDVSKIENAYLISNCNKEKIEGLTIISHTQKLLFTQSGDKIIPNMENEFVIGDLEPFQTKIFYTSLRNKRESDETLFTKKFKNGYMVVNLSMNSLYDQKIELPFDGEIFNHLGKKINKYKHIINVEKLRPYENFSVFKDKSGILIGSEIGILEKFKLIAGRILVYIQDGNFLKAKYWKR